MTNTEAIARRYYELVNAQDLDNLLSMFADDVRFVLPDGQKVEGKGALKAMYKDVFERGGPQPQAVRLVAGDNGVAVEVEVSLADGRILSMASFFHTDKDGKVTDVGVYRRS